MANCVLRKLALCERYTECTQKENIVLQRYLYIKVYVCIIDTFVYIKFVASIIKHRLMYMYLRYRFLFKMS